MKLPNCPNTLSFVQIYQWATRPTDFLDSCTQNYGDIFITRWPGSSMMVFVSHPKAIEQIYTAPPETFNIAQTYEILRPVVGNQSLMLMDGKPHQRQRTLVMPSMHGDRMRLFGQTICELTQQMMRRSQIGEVINLGSCAQDISLSMMLQVVFGSQKGERLVQLRQKFTEMMDYASSPILSLHLFMQPLQKDLGSWSPWGRFVRLRNQVKQILHAEIAQRHKQPQSKHTDVLSLLMAARDENDQPMSDEELHDELMTLLLGKETTATAILWALYWVYKHPAVLQQLREELDSISDSSDTNAIAKLPYLTAVTQETLRLYPPVIVAMRIATTSFKTMGYEFPAGTQIFPNIYSLHKNQELFPNPKHFQPERFLARQFSNYEYLPFGSGHRRCIGYAFAPFQMKLVLATIVSRYQLELTDNSSIHPVRHAAGVAPDKDIFVKLLPR